MTLLALTLTVLVAVLLFAADITEAHPTGPPLAALVGPPPGSVLAAARARRYPDGVRLCAFGWPDQYEAPEEYGCDRCQRPEGCHMCRPWSDSWLKAAA